MTYKIHIKRLEYGKKIGGANFMINALVVDDEHLIRAMIKEYFGDNNITVIEAENGIEGIKEFEKNKDDIDIIILDVMMPKMDGVQCCKKIRDMSKVPILMLTAKTETNDEITGLTCGANDYVSKPFSLEVLLLRVRKLTDTESDANCEIEIIEEEKSVKKNGRKIELTNKEFELLDYLYINRGQVVSRDQILDRVWGMDYFGDYRTVDTHIKRLRKKVDKQQKYIKTYRGVGYKFAK